MARGGAPAALPGMRVGVPVDDYWHEVEPAIGEATAAALASLQRRGAQVVEVRTPMIAELAAAYVAIVGAEGYASHAAWLAERPDAYQRATRVSLESFAGQPAHEYVEALRTRRRLTAALRRAVRDADVLVLPTTPLRATPIGKPIVTVHGEPMAVGHSLLAFTLPFNMTGMPAVSVPVPGAGLPVGIQVVGVRIDEHSVLRVAASFALAP